MRSSPGPFRVFLVVVSLTLIGVIPVSAGAMPVSGPYEVTVTRSRTNPQDVTITWKTSQATKSWIEYQDSTASAGQTVYDQRGEETLDTLHRVALRGIGQEADHLFAIIVNGIRYDNHGTPYRILPNASYLSAELTAALGTALGSLPALSNGTALPLETQLLYLDFDGQNLTLDLTEAALSLGKGASLEELQTRISLAVDAFLDGRGLGEQRSVNYHILIEGLPAFAPQPLVRTATAPTSIQDKQIVLSPGHGRYDDGSDGWPLQRSYFWGIVEDYVNLDLVSQLNNLMSGTGAIPRPIRQVNKNYGNHYSGYAWWQMDAREYVKDLGAPSSVWNYGTGGVNQDIDARPLYANWIEADALVTIHNNGGGGCGTETWYDNANGYQTASLALANLVQTRLIDRIRTQWNPAWCNRGVKGTDYYGENRLFNGPAILMELGFMDNQSDNSALQNSTFRSIATSAIRDALVDYFGGVAVDDATFVADITVPDNTEMGPNQSFTKVWRMQNTGISTWGSGYSWAFVSGDPLSASASVSVPSTPPGNQTDISVDMVAPNSLGTFQGNWRMRNAQGTLFGETTWVKINVSGGPCTLASDEIVLYSNTGYGNPCKTLGIGDYNNPSAMGFSNDDAESIKVGSDVQAILCLDDNYGGLCTSPITSDTSDLNSTSLGNNQLSSLHVQIRPGYCPQSRGVVLYWNANYDCSNSMGDPGFRQRTSLGWQNVIDGQFNDKASSLRVPSGWSVRLYANANRAEPSVCYNSNVADFSTQGNFPDSSTPINDNVSSMQVFPNASCSSYNTLYLPWVRR